MIEELVYILCGLTSILCACLLYRQYCSMPSDLLYWSTGCFICLAVTNVLLFVDLVVIPATDLSSLRSLITLTGMLMLLYGLVQERT